MDIYDLYKPFRNQLRKLALFPSLHHIWVYQKQAHHQTGVIKIPGITDIYIWELQILCREVVLHAAGKETTLSTHQGLRKMISHIRRIIDGIAAIDIANATENFSQRALLTMAHQQARWQYSRDEARLFRAYHVYSDSELAPLFEQITGLSVRAMYLQALAIGGAATKQAGTNATQDYSAFDVTNLERNAFFKMSGTTITSLREALNVEQRYDERWALTFNPMEATPLFNTDHHHPSLFWCPMPQLLLRRVTEGLFFDLMSGKKELGVEFGNEYGHAFERYVGRVLHEIFDSNQFSISGERPYEVNGDTKHGVDWIVSDATANLFIECKTRRLSQKAKETGGGEALDKSLDEMAKDIVKFYINIDHAIKGLSTWVNNGSKIYPMIVTYEEWYLLYPTAFDRLVEFVKARLEAKKLPATWTESMPFFFTSIAEFEQAGQDINHLGIERFFSVGATRTQRHFQLSILAHTAFPDEAKPHRRLLGNSWEEIFPKLQEWSEMAGIKEGWWIG